VIENELKSNQTGSSGAEDSDELAKKEGRKEGSA